MREIEAVAFDKDGTLFDFNATWGRWAFGFLQEVCAGRTTHLERACQALRYDMAGKRFLPDSLVIAGTADEVAQALGEAIETEDLAALRARLLHTTAEAPQTEVTPLDPLFDGLRTRELQLGIVTNDAEAPARGNLRAVGIEAHFDFIAGFDSGYGGKPEPGQLIAFAEHCGVDPDRCAMVGDSLHDLHAARAAGFAAVAVLTGVATRDDLAPAADVVLHSIADLPAWLDS